MILVPFKLAKFVDIRLYSHAKEQQGLLMLGEVIHEKEFQK